MNPNELAHKWNNIFTDYSCNLSRMSAYIDSVFANIQYNITELTVREFIENNIDLIEKNEFDKLYCKIADNEFAVNVTKELLEAEINPFPYLSSIPDYLEPLVG